ncbi:MAG: SMP-30/gluconolactonase/LRE family protein [Bacteroidia bacterium]|nr:SMP-30/gluconolactonase/LRE family protein [Bacteroidia bacterium]
MNRILLAIIMSIFLSCNNDHFKTTGSIEKIDDSLSSILADDAKPEIIAEGFEWSEGPVWVEDQKMLLFSDVLTNTIYKWTEEKGKEVYLTPSGYTGTVPRGGEMGSNGLTLNKDGKLVLCQHGNRQMAWMDADLSAPKPDFNTIADNYQGKKLNSPNDAVYRSNGDLFFTDPPYGLLKNVDDSSKEIPFQGVYKVSPFGGIKLLTDSLTRPNGIAFMPGEKTLLVANSDPDKKKWYAFDLDANDSLINPRIFYDASSSPSTEKGLPDGMKIDKNGNVFATGPGGLWIFNKEGKLLGKIKLDEATSNCAFSPDQKILYITNDMNVLRVKLK